MDYSRLAYTHHRAKAQAYGAAGLGTKARAHAERASYHRAAFGGRDELPVPYGPQDSGKNAPAHQWYGPDDHGEIYQSVLRSGAGLGLPPKPHYAGFGRRPLLRRDEAMAYITRKLAEDESANMRYDTAEHVLGRRGADPAARWSQSQLDDEYEKHRVWIEYGR
jgi:hypothetical protein